MGSKALGFVCPRFFHHYVFLTGQSNMSINFRVRLIRFLINSKSNFLCNTKAYDLIGLKMVTERN